MMDKNCNFYGRNKRQLDKYKKTQRKLLFHNHIEIVRKKQNH